MARPTPLTLAVILLTAAGCLAASVHVRTADGTWVELEAEEQDGTVGFAIAPEQADAGRALVVINKPDWMVLEDETPPGVISYSIGEGTWELSDASTVTLSGLGEAEGERQVTFTVSDDANPIDVDSALLRIEGRSAVRAQVVEDDREGRAAKLAIDLNEFGPGAWRGTLEVADLSPLGNRVTLPLRFSIAGAQIAENGQTLTLSGGGAGFTVKGDKRQTVAVDAAGVSAFITVQPEGRKHLYVREFANVEDLGVENGWHLIGARVALEDIDGQPVTDGQVGASLEMRFAVHGDIPAIVVTSSAKNLADAARTMYAFWGWLPGEGYVTADGVEHEWTMEYGDVAPDGWLLLPARAEGKPGVGWISDEDFGQSRFGTMILYTSPQKPQLAPGEAVQTTFALMPATTIEEVAEVARRLVEEGALELGPQQ